MGSNHRPPDYEWGVWSILGLHWFVLVVIVIHLRFLLYIHYHWFSQNLSDFLADILFWNNSQNWIGSYTVSQSNKTL
jgi:hypothetical protein